MDIELTEEQLERIIKALENDTSQTNNKYLVEYLQSFLNPKLEVIEFEWDEIPF
jgi:hypothetical protein